MLCFWYILRVANPDPQAVQSALRDFVEPRILDDVMTAAERLESAAERRLFIKQLRERFGVLPSSAEERISSASDETFEVWMKRMWTATSLEELLRPA